MSERAQEDEWARAVNSPVAKPRERPSWASGVPLCSDIDRLPAFARRIANRQLTGLNIRLVDDGWQAVIKANNRRGRREVAFLNADHWDDLLELVVYYITHDGLVWREDRY